MRTSLNELDKIEQHLSGCNKGEDEFLFQVNLLINPHLAENVEWQKKTYSLIRAYGRKKLRMEIEQVHNELFSTPEHRNFRQRILSIFRK